MTDDTMTRRRVRGMPAVHLLAVAALIASLCGIAVMHAQQPRQRGAGGGPRGGVSADVQPPAGDGSALTEEQLQQLVVMLTVKLGEVTLNGAGIIFGQRGDQLYILTARHVVREGEDRKADSVRVRFKWLPGESKDGKVLDDATDKDDPLDLAVLAVSGASSLSLPAFKWNAYTSPSRIKPGQDVVPIGFPDGRAWFTPQLRSKVQEVGSQFIEFQGGLNTGNSGGALVTDDWSIVALVSQIRTPTNRSTRIDLAIQKLKEWGYPVSLTERTSAGGSVSSGAGAAAGSVAQGRQGRGVPLPPINDRARWRLEYFPPPNAGNVLITKMLDGSPACASYDGGGCLWGMTADQVNFTRLNPLVCGDGHKAKWGVTGYDDPKHWCSLARQLP